MYPPFLRVLMLVVCLFALKSVQFARYRGFRVICVLTKFDILFCDFEMTYLSFSNVLILMVCLHFLNHSPFERYRGLKNLGGLDK
jgi:hypothetical protein